MDFVPRLSSRMILAVVVIVGVLSIAFTPAAAAASKVTPGSVTVTGTFKVGSTLTAKPGTWKPTGVTLTYQWLRNGKAIAKATKNKYVLTAADGEAKISVNVTGKKSGYVSVAKVSAAKAVGYKNCSALNAKYPHGVGKPGAHDHVSGSSKPVTTFKVSAALFAANSSLDRDKDGVACEKK